MKVIRFRLQRSRRQKHQINRKQVLYNTNVFGSLFITLCFIGNATPSDDDEREECPDGTACKVRTNTLHRKKYKHVRISATEEIAGV